MKLSIILFSVVLSGSVFGQMNHDMMKMPKETDAVVIDEGLGNINHPVSTKNTEAQKFFNQGLAYMYAFNHAEAIKSFKRAAELDANLAMAYWGAALGL